MTVGYFIPFQLYKSTNGLILNTCSAWFLSSLCCCVSGKACWKYLSSIFLELLLCFYVLANQGTLMHDDPFGSFAVAHLTVICTWWKLLHLFVQIFVLVFYQFENFFNKIMNIDFQQNYFIKTPNKHFFFNYFIIIFLMITI